jgi:16S rRNA (uracil1498-N3)-methyltransferase
MPRFFVGTPFKTDDIVSLPDEVNRHVRVLRLQPGDTVSLFNGTGGEYGAEIVDMDRH